MQRHPPDEVSTRTLNVVYDLRYLPVTFDSATFLIGADATRQLIGAEFMHVYYYAPNFRRLSERDKLIQEDEKRWRTLHMLTQIPLLLPQTSVTYSERFPESIHFPIYPDFYQPNFGPQLASAYAKLYQFKFLYQFLKSDTDLKRFACPVISPAGYRISNSMPTITISLRTSKFQIKRNSNLEAWASFYVEMKSKGYRVIVIPDFEDVVGERVFRKYFQEIDISIEASVSLLLRCRIYESAIHNFGVNNGVMSMLIHSRNPYSMFKVITSDYLTTSVQHLNDVSGLRPNERPPFSGENQHWVWMNDDIESIISHSNKLGL